ncbi:MAG: nucleotide-diphospho-sugar transferase [Candidatus Paceibacteria bacterium]
MMKQKKGEKINGLSVPVLFLVFNRLDTTKKVFEEIRKAKPKQLFIAADGPRTKEEKNKTDSIRNHITENIDWDCEVKKLFREENLGCDFAIPGAIDWFFKNVEQGIILEDDCLPSQSFFRFCQELLEKYKKNENIAYISGFNKGGPITDKDYFFSYGGFIWGWATWKRAWKDYTTDKNKLENLQGAFKNPRFGRTFLERLRSKQSFLLSFTKIGGWDCRWNLITQIKRKMVITPNKSLVTNIGWGEGATRTNNKDSRSKIQRKNIEFPLDHPKKISPILKKTGPSAKTDFFNALDSLKLALRRNYYYLFGK